MDAVRGKVKTCCHESVNRMFGPGVAWLSATGIEGRDNGFRIRKTGDTEWNEDRRSHIYRRTFTAMPPRALTPLIYECVAYSGDEVTGS